ncbi:glycosyltransferase [Rhizobium laguerreae]|uniref:glycosyltransferase n=1 Tax=Rhizobium laguerreae TaxID=1076926 RepID=UPI001C92ADCF|nr:glycosyltransferase [Rhizobium laguerreae]MBY3515015.1 glycosyltransferase [Rhizobium laguerreae]
MPSLRIPKISIVTPSLNQGRFLQDCIDSIRAQNWPNCEHFIIDGGSTDQTMDLIRQNEGWLTSFVSEKDGGAADAINKGIARCSGDIVAWLNADDFYLPGAFQAVADAFSREPGASFWFGNGIRVDERGVEKAAFNSNAVRYDRRALVEGLDYILQPAAFINRRILDEVGVLDTNLRWSFDWDLWIRLGAYSQPAVIDTQLAASREWEETLTSNGGFRRAEELRRLAERHSGQAMTPGALCYWLDSINFFIAKSSTFSRDTSAALFELWREVQKDMQQLNVDSSGNPLPKDAATSLIGGASNTFDRRPLTIAVDLYPLIAGVSGGIVPWVQGVLRELARLFPEDRVVMFHRPGQPPLYVDAANVEYVPLDDHPVRFYAEMTRHCESIGVEAVIRTYPQEQHPGLPFTRQIFVIPDIQHEFFPEFFSKQVLAVRRRAFAYALSCGGAIATMSEHSRETMVSNGWTLTDDVFLMPAALPEELRETASDSDLPAAAAAFQQYFYMPANLWSHKNHRRLFEAFKLAFPHLPPSTGLVLSGNPEGLNDVLKDFKDLPIVHVGFVPHRQVAALFSRAIALVYFSLFEGFGMPLLEAFHHGTPVLCSNTTSLPEVGGDAVLSCDPTDVPAMAELMQRITAEPGLREVLSAKAKLRVLAYDWAKPAQELRGALDRVARNPIEYPERQPLVSIVMPTRNHAHFIRQSIDSVISQSYAKIELLVMDGASTDNTVEILKEYGNRIRWISEPDKGQADAINKGMELVSGDILAYLNSDDILLPGAVARAVRYFSDHPECDIVYGNADYIDVNGVVTGSYATAEYTFERLMHDCCVCQPAAFWKRRIVDRIGPFDASLQTAMDYEYWLRMATSGAILHHTIEKLAQSRLHEDAKTLAMRGKIFEEVFAICERHGGYVSFSYFLGLWSYRFYEAWRGGGALRRVAPRAYKLAALIHFIGQMMRIGMDREKTAYVGRTLFGVVENRSPGIGKLIRKMWANSTTLRQRFR